MTLTTTASKQRDVIAGQQHLLGARNREIIELKTNAQNFKNERDWERMESARLRSELAQRKSHVESRESGCVGTTWLKQYLVQNVDPGLSDMNVGDLVRVCDSFVRKRQRKRPGQMLDPVHKLSATNASLVVDEIERQGFNYKGCKTLIHHLLCASNDLSFKDVCHSYNRFNNAKGAANTELHSGLPSKGPELVAVVLDATTDGTINCEALKQHLRLQHTSYVPTAMPSHPANYLLTRERVPGGHGGRGRDGGGRDRAPLSPRERNGKRKR